MVAGFIGFFREVFVHTSTRLLLGCTIVLIHAATPVASATRRPLALEDFYAIKFVEDASTSADVDGPYTPSRKSIARKTPVYRASGAFRLPAARPRKW
jgi:hypothetical protein